MSQEEFENSSPWEFAAKVDGWNKAQGSDDDNPPAMTPEEFDEILKRKGYSVH